MKKILVMLALFTVLIVIGPASASLSGSSGSPVTANVKYVVTTNTNFVVVTNDPSDSGDPADELNFSKVKKNGVDMQPEGQNVSIQLPWGNITNNGEVSQTFKAKLGAASPTGLSLYLSNNSDYSGQILLNPTTATGPTAWSGIATGATVTAYFRLNASGATDGSYTNTLQISSS